MTFGDGSRMVFRLSGTREQIHDIVASFLIFQTGRISIAEVRSLHIQSSWKSIEECRQLLLASPSLCSEGTSLKTSLDCSPSQKICQKAEKRLLIPSYIVVHFRRLLCFSTNPSCSREADCPTVVQFLPCRDIAHTLTGGSIIGHRFTAEVAACYRTLPKSI